MPQRPVGPVEEINSLSDLRLSDETLDSMTSDEAFQKLVRVSQNANIKLREIAQRYVEAWEEKAQAGDKPVRR